MATDGTIVYGILLAGATLGVPLIVLTWWPT